MRTSHKRVGLSCRATQLLSNTLELKCCSKCHETQRTLTGQHHMGWYQTPTAPKEFDPGQAFVCCTFGEVVRRACTKGWDHAGPKNAKGKPAQQPTPYATAWATTGTATMASYELKGAKTGLGMWIFDHPKAVTCHLEKVVDVTLAHPISTFSAKILADLGNDHLPLYEVVYGKNLKKAVDQFCMNPKCIACGGPKSLYWSYKMQCWVPEDRYGILDNALHLSVQHPGEITGHHCSKHAVKTGTSVVSIPEFDAVTCRTSTGAPTFGYQYGVLPRHVAVIDFQAQGESDGFRYISHTHGSVPVDLSYLVWAYVGEEW